MKNKCYKCDKKGVVSGLQWWYCAEHWQEFLDS